MLGSCSSVLWGNLIFFRHFLGPRQRILTELVPHQSRKSIEGALHIRDASVQKDLSRRPETQHERAATTARISESSARGTSAGTSTRLPQGKSMRITESRGACGLATTGTSKPAFGFEAFRSRDFRSHPDTVDTETPFASANALWSLRSRDTPRPVSQSPSCFASASSF